MLTTFLSRLAAQRDTLRHAVARRFLRTIHSLARGGGDTASTSQHDIAHGELRGEAAVSSDVEPTFREQIHQIISGLPSLQQLVLMRHINDQMTYKQIAAELHMQPRDCLRLLSQTYATLSCELRRLEGGAASLSCPPEIVASRKLQDDSDPFGS